MLAAPPPFRAAVLQPCARRGRGPLAPLRPRACASPPAAASAPALDAASPPAPFQLVTFYSLVSVPDVQAELARHRAWAAAGRDLRGRIYLSEQGINAQLSGAGSDALDYAAWATAPGSLFHGARVSSYGVQRHAFPRLALRYKQLVQLGDGVERLQVARPEARAVALSPAQWHAALAAREAALAAEPAAPAPPPPVLLDVRNGYEWDCGRFEGAERPVAESFRETLDAYSAPGGPLAGVPPETPIMMYCTGGIRCDFYSAALKERGYRNMYTLEGGVQAYLDSPCGPAAAAADSAWRGQLFVFDARLALSADGEQAEASGGDASLALTCHCCAAPRAAAPHRNCPNVDCNRLFLVCTACLQRLGGFCCSSCTSATHLRPPLLQPGERYARWSHYADGGAASTAARRGDGRALRKARTRERRQREAHELAVAAVAATMSGGDVTAALAGAGTAARRARAARIAAALASAPEDMSPDSEFARMRERLKAEAAARLAAAGGERAAV